MYGLLENSEEEVVPDYCRYGIKNPGYHCLKNNCPYLGHAPAPHEIAFSGEDGEVADDTWIGFGGDMEPDIFSKNKDLELKELWKEICKDKIQKSYEEYMDRSNLNGD
ncbi:hypothetical protein [Paenibacillus daejeonensis]|uniref:hypothetical protein n=1 Tax=Paenibacillus daejeonensis TaxID=135193 RepID=UPI0012FA2F91|nr:hypothetical protein [Paenibacillus daejeonensis]